MRIFAAGISTESNTFAPWPTGQRGFEEGGYWRGTASVSGECEQNLVARLFRGLKGQDNCRLGTGGDGFRQKSARLLVGRQQCHHAPPQFIISATLPPDIIRAFLRRQLQGGIEDGFFAVGGFAHDD